MGQDLVLLTCCASFYIVRNPLVHPTPLLELLSFFYRFVSSWMSCGGMIMSQQHERLLLISGRLFFCPNRVDKVVRG
jgi:hypothetical protein